MGAKGDYEKALALYDECGDPDAHAELVCAHLLMTLIGNINLPSCLSQEYMLEQLDYEIDKVATITKKMAEKTAEGIKDKEAVETAFKKFDVDGSGTSKALTSEEAL